MIFIYFLFKDNSKKTVFNDKLDNFMRKIHDVESDKLQSIRNVDLTNISNDEAKLKFFQLLAFPQQSFCKILKRLGGAWIFHRDFNRQQVDGDKFICLDDILVQDRCIVYSFGVNNEWSFEDMMDVIGCEVYAYDHTVHAPSRRGKNIHFFKTGIGFGQNLKPLSDLIRRNDHHHALIDYLKIDVEGFEFSDGGFKDWIESGALKQVKQIAIELHVYNEESNLRQYIELMQLLKDLHQLGFVIISQEVNMVYGASSDGFYHLLEVVFLKI